MKEACDAFSDGYCTYNRRSNRRRNPIPQYIESLGQRLQRAEALLGTVLPNVDLGDPNLISMIEQRLPANSDLITRSGDEQALVLSTQDT